MTKAHEVAFSPDGKTLSVGYDHGRVELFDAITGESKQVLGEYRDEFYPFVAYSPDGKMLALPSSDVTEVVVRTLETGTDLLLTGHHEGTVHDVAFSPDSRLLASASGDGTVRIWDLRVGGTPKTLPGHSSDVWSVAFSPDGRTLACGTDVGTIKLWDWRREEELASIIGSPFPSPNNDMQRIWSLAFSKKGGVLAAGCGDWSVRIVDLATRRVQNILTGHRDEVRCVAISPDGRTLASAGRDSTVKLWHLKTRKELETLKGFSFGGHACAFSPKDAILASAGVDYRILLWDLNAKMEVDAFQIETEKRLAIEGSIAFSPSGETMACRVSEANGVVKTYRTTDGKEKLCVRTGETVRCMSVSKREVLALGGIGTIKLRSLRGNKELGDIRLNPIVVVTALDFSRDGKKLAVGGSDGSISIHSLEARETTRAGIEPEPGLCGVKV